MAGPNKIRALLDKLENILSGSILKIGKSLQLGWKDPKQPPPPIPPPIPPNNSLGLFQQFLRGGKPPPAPPAPPAPPPLFRQVFQSIGGAAQAFRGATPEQIVSKNKADFQQAKERTPEQNIQAKLNRVGAGFGQMTNVFRNERAGNIVGDAAGAAGDILGTAGPLGAAAGGVLKFGEVVATSIERLRDWNNELHAADLKFAEFSGSMTRVMVERQIRDMQLSQERGERRAASAQGREEESSRLDRNLAILEDGFANIKNAIATQLMGKINDILEWLKWKFGGGPAVPPPPPVTAGTFMSDVAELTFGPQWGRPDRFPD